MDPTVKRFNTTPLEYLSREQMRDIHSAALEILEDCGTVIHHEKALELLHKAGAYVKDDRQVFIPVGLVEWAIGRAPSRVTIHDRNGTPFMFLEGRNVYYGTGSDCPNLLDSFTGERREFLSGDVADAVRLVDREYLAVDTIKRVGPGGHFLQDDHTLNHFRENWHPDLTDRKTYEAWKMEGAMSMGQRAKQKVRHILDNYRPQPLQAEVDAEIDKILARIKGGENK